jgi:hypothetical protein
VKQWLRVAAVILASLVVLGVAISRLINAISGNSRTTQTIGALPAAPNPTCAEPQNQVSPLCSDNPCNSASRAYNPGDPSCGSFTTPRTPTFPATQPSTSRPSRTPSHRGPPPPAGPVPPASLSRALDKQLTLYIDVTPGSVACPPLARRKGTTVTCRVTGRNVGSNAAQVHGTARVTITDRSGQTASATFSLTGPGGLSIRGSGYPFDPDTGRVL